MSIEDGGDDLETLDLRRPEVARPTKLPRSGASSLRIWALLVGVVASIAGVMALALSDDLPVPQPSAAAARGSAATSRSTIPQAVSVELQLRPGEQRCSADRDFADSLAHATAAELTRRGAADGLPEYGATTIEHVVAAVRLADKAVRNAHPGVAAVTVGRGLGWTFSEPATSSIAYHRVSDFQVVVHLRREFDCPQFPSFVTNDVGQRVPSLYVYPSNSEP